MPQSVLGGAPVTNETKVDLHGCGQGGRVDRISCEKVSVGAVIIHDDRGPASPVGSVAESHIPARIDQLVFQGHGLDLVDVRHLGGNQDIFPGGRLPWGVVDLTDEGRCGTCTGWCDGVRGSRGWLAGGRAGVRDLQFQVEGEVAAVQGGIEGVNCHHVGSAYDNVASIIDQLLLPGALVAVSGTVVELISGAYRKAGYFHSIDPDDGTIVDVTAE